MPRNASPPEDDVSESIRLLHQRVNRIEREGRPMLSGLPYNWNPFAGMTKEEKAVIDGMQARIAALESSHVLLDALIKELRDQFKAAQGDPAALPAYPSAPPAPYPYSPPMPYPSAPPATYPSAPPAPYPSAPPAPYPYGPPPDGYVQPSQAGRPAQPSQASRPAQPRQTRAPEQPSQAGGPAQSGPARATGRARSAGPTRK